MVNTTLLKVGSLPKKTVRQCLTMFAAFMVYLVMWFQTEAHSSQPGFGGGSTGLFKPQSASHQAFVPVKLRLNQELETGLRCLCSKNPSTWKKQLFWVEYAHNTPSSATGLSPFESAHVTYLPCFWNSKKRPVFSLLMPLFIGVVEHNSKYDPLSSASLPATSPSPTEGVLLLHATTRQKVWLSTRDLPLWEESHNLAPW